MILSTKQLEDIIELLETGKTSKKIRLELLAAFRQERWTRAHLSRQDVARIKEAEAAGRVSRHVILETPKVRNVSYMSVDQLEKELGL